MNGERFDGYKASFSRPLETWQVETALLEADGFDEHDHRLYFGIRPEYSSLISIVWSIVDNEQVRLKPPSKKSTDAEVMAWWLAPIHLLALGLGWDDISAGIAAWKIRGYPEENHILRFIKRNWGTTIDVLEFWANVNGDHLKRTLREFSYNDADSHFGNRANESSTFSAQSSDFEFEHLFRPLEQDMRDISNSMRDDVSTIFTSGLSVFTMRPWSEGEWALWENSELTFNFQRYEGWMKRAIQSVQELAEDGEDSPFASTMHVIIEGIGSLGKYKLHKETGRWVRQGRDAESEWQDDFWHIVGVTTR